MTFTSVLASRRTMLASFLPTVLLVVCLVLLFAGALSTPGLSAPGAVDGRVTNVGWDSMLIGIAFPLTFLSAGAVGAVALFAAVHAVLNDAIAGHVRLGVLLLAMIVPPFAYFAYWVTHLRHQTA